MEGVCGDGWTLTAGVIDSSRYEAIGLLVLGPLKRKAV